MDDLAIKLQDAFPKGGHRGGRKFCIGWTRGMWYFRLFGCGLHVKDFRKARLLFSEREYGVVKKPILIVGYWKIKVLKP